MIKKQKKLKEEINNLEEMANLKKVENSIINKMNNMKFNYQNDSIKDELNFDNSLKINPNNTNSNNNSSIKS